MKRISLIVHAILYLQVEYGESEHVFEKPIIVRNELSVVLTRLPINTVQLVRVNRLNAILFEV